MGAPSLVTVEGYAAVEDFPSFGASVEPAELLGEVFWMRRRRRAGNPGIAFLVSGALLMLQIRLCLCLCCGGCLSFGV